MREADSTGLPFQRKYRLAARNATSPGYRMDTTSFSYSSAIVAHLAYFGIAIVAIVAFVTIYIAVTPHREFTLIRQGNTAAAISLGGAILGYTIPLAKAVAQSDGMRDMLLWSGVALVAQLLAYGATRVLLPHLSSDVNEGKDASAIFLAAMSICIGLLNAAAMTE
jgi:putative membrane protein